MPSASRLVIELMPLSLMRIFLLQPAVELIVRLIGLADQDAQAPADGIDLEAAHRQPGVEGTSQQARGFSSPVACESARASLERLWRALRHKACLFGADTHYGTLWLVLLPLQAKFYIRIKGLCSFSA